MKRNFILAAMFVVLRFGAVPGYAQVTPGTLFYFPQVAAGSGGGLEYSTVYVFTNPGATALQVRTDLFDSNGNPLALQVVDLLERNLGTIASVDLFVPANGLFGFLVSSSGGIRTGWARVSSSGPFWAASAFELSTVNGTPISSVGVPAMSSLQEAVINVLKDKSDRLDVGVAVANPSDSALTITASLRDAFGVQAGQVTFTLPARGHRAVFSGELFLNLPDVFAGTLTLTAPAAFTLMSLLIEGELMTSLPVFRRP